MKFLEVASGEQIGVVSGMDGDLPAPGPISDGLVGLEDGHLIVLDSLRKNRDVDSYAERFSDYLETAGRGGCRKISWFPEALFRQFLSKLREPESPTSSSTIGSDSSDLEQTSGDAPPLEIYPETGEIVIPDSLSGKVVVMEDGQIAATDDLKGHPEFDDFVRKTSLRMDACGKIGQMRVSHVSERTLRDLLARRRGQSQDEDYRVVLADLGLESLKPLAEEEAPIPAEKAGQAETRKPPEEIRSEAVASRQSSPEASMSGSPEKGPGKELSKGKKEPAAAGGQECLSTPSGGTIPDFRAPDDIATMVLLFLDGRFYASREHKANQHVNYYCRHFVPDLWPKIFGDKPVPKPQYVPYETLRKIRLESLPEESVSAGYKAEGDEARKIMEILREAVSQKASDIHLRVERDRTRVLFRLHGWLKPVQTLTHDEGERLARIVYNTMLDSAGRDNMFSDKKPQDGQFRQSYLPTPLVNIREAHVPTGGTGLGTLTMVLRLQYGSGLSTASAQDIDLLGYREDHLSQLRFLMGLSSGIIIFSGPMGSGKTTSIAAMLYLVQKMNPLEEGLGKHILTLEDPVEYEISGASQVDVPGGRFMEYTGRTMRLDADILGIGEIREEDVARAAIADAMSGHVVYTTTHSNDVLTIFRRLDGLSVRRDLLSDPSLFRGMVSQRLVPFLCPDCKLSWKEAEKGGILRPDLSKRLEDVSAEPEEVFFQRRGGCGTCNNQGISGRTVVAEILIPDQEILDAVLGGRMMEARRYYSEKLEGRTMMEHAIEKIRAGIVDPRHVENRLEWIHRGTLDSQTIRKIIGGF